jgi:hypothetical protein
MSTTPATHSPGPWKVDIWNYSQATPPRKELCIQNKDLRLAVLDWDEGQDNPYTVAEQTAQANARLIAAAPDLFAALEDLIPHVLHYVPMPHAHADAAKHVAAARAAIARATTPNDL